VYLPDCQGLLKSPFGYLRSALKLTFADVRECRQYLDDSKTCGDLVEFCNAAAPTCCLFFILDQADAVDPKQSLEMDKNDNEAKRAVHKLLNDISSGHLKFACVGANYRGVLEEEDNHTQVDGMKLYEGLGEVC
jgi:hypothetical protein